MIVPFLIFWVIMFLARHELGWRGALVSIAVWGGLLAGFVCLHISPPLFVAAQSLLDIILILVVFKGDIRIS